ncbi:hypothetical protein N8525_04340 [Verrucomicrobiales bacterium]|jgi:hypothetical protein|nr:hypothetical protein [Verrucomicrobiales bacterium]MDB4627026.1 hypothetical protein [bacterium]MDA7526374.1 hypothetical protein [Verrucomicrobiales bacterium]MDC0312727.1 hypothetical protein [Verrucomicrobiales bacterium]MDC0503318.1 hypothetical protein [Verrucomicrobiales bacterium]
MIRHETNRPARIATALALVKAPSITSAIDSPSFVLEKNDQRMLTAPTGTVYCTADGTEPRD